MPPGCEAIIDFANSTICFPVSFAIPRMIRLQAGGYKCSLFLFGRDLLVVHDPAAFQDRIKLVGLEVFDRLDLAGRPLDLERIDLPGVIQAEMHPEIVAGKITPSA